MKLKDLPAAFLLCTYKWGTEMKHSFQVIIYFLINCYFNWLRDENTTTALWLLPWPTCLAFRQSFWPLFAWENVRLLAHVISDPPFSCRGTKKEDKHGQTSWLHWRKWRWSKNDKVFLKNWKLIVLKNHSFCAPFNVTLKSLLTSSELD